MSKELSIEAIEHMLSLSKKAHAGDMHAAESLARIGDVVFFVGGVEGLCDVQAQLGDHEIACGSRGNYSGLAGAYWEHIDAWAKL